MKLRIMASCLIFLLGSLLATPKSVVAQSRRAEIDQSITDNIGDPAKFQAFFSSLKQAVEKHDASAVSAMVSYPMTIHPGTKGAIHVRTPQNFIAQYDKIVTPHIADIIQKQKYEDLFVNGQGAMLGSGEVWIGGICKDKTCKQSEIKIRTIQNTAGKSK
jgi:hypothetical protein